MKVVKCRRLTSKSEARQVNGATSSVVVRSCQLIRFASSYRNNGPYEKLRSTPNVFYGVLWVVRLEEGD